MNDDDRVFFDKVVQEFYVCEKSLRRTANRLGLSRSKVKRILITMGEIQSEIAEKALPWMEQGYSQQEIADMLHISEATLATHLPYGDCVYNREEKSSDAIRSKEYRTRQALAAMHQVQQVGMKRKKMQQTGMSHEAYAQNKNRCERNTFSYAKEEGRERMKGHMEKVPAMKEDKTRRVLRLRLALDLEYGDEAVLRKFGKVQEGIIREVLIPVDYPLHALHYVIQKLFGWQNSHLHHFHLDEEDMEKLVKDSFQRYCDLCGMYFRFAYDDEDYADIYWDDDYEPGKSFKSWLKKKYSSPEKYQGLLENYLIAQMEVTAFRSDHEILEIRPSFKEWCEGKKKSRWVRFEKASYKDMVEYFEGGLGELLERVSVGEVLSFGCAGLKSVDDAIHEHKGTYQRNLDEYMFLNERVGGFSEEMDNLLDGVNGTVQPIVDHLMYEYDYGDGWKVTIQLMDEYTENSNCADGGESKWISERSGESVSEISSDLMEAISQVAQTGVPVCTYVDGLPVLDDVGGVGGYCDFLLGIHGYDNDGPYDDPDDSREWARSLGWSGRISRVL